MAREHTRPFLGPRIVAVAFASLTGAFGLNLAYGQFFAPLTRQFGWGLDVLSGTVAVNMIVWGLMQPVMGRLIDVFGPRTVMTANAALMGVSFVLLAGVQQVWQFVLLAGVAAAIGFAGCSSMPASVLVARWHVRGRPQALARSSMGINAGQLLLLPLAGVLIAGPGWRAAFPVLGAVMLALVAPVIWFGSRDHPADVGQRPDGAPAAAAPPAAGARMGQALADGQFWLTSLSFAGCGYSLYMFTTHMPKFAVELGGSASVGGWLMALVAVCSAASMWASGQWAARRWGKRRPLIALHLVRAAGFAVLALADSIPLLVLGVVLFGVSSFPVIPLTTGVIADRFGAGAMGGILGSAWLLHQLAAGAGVFLGGLLRQATDSYAASFASGAVVLLVAAVLAATIREGRAADPAEAPTPAAKT
ncbi:MFS transporter [Streptomonospora litoralis]|uniref:Major Facilitator Superfamily protein n=1 Tax=Streptomonospora litoralis TaxID=2498135 RepID=A0A4P6Q7P6_9ACTN|nr:MFS transporter [Streptomonospora litoralis]QBI55461.1 Major Facilitator Superfamily protein [Streptomonospora litoralis]